MPALGIHYRGCLGSNKLWNHPKPIVKQSCAIKESIFDQLTREEEAGRKKLSELLDAHVKADKLYKIKLFKTCYDDCLIQKDAFWGPDPADFDPDLVNTIEGETLGNEAKVIKF